MEAKLPSTKYYKNSCTATISSNFMTLPFAIIAKTCPEYIKNMLVYSPTSIS